jgi:hypothetical protein
MKQSASMLALLLIIFVLVSSPQIEAMKAESNFLKCATYVLSNLLGFLV